MFKKLIGLRRTLLVFLASFTVFGVVHFYSIRMTTGDSFVKASAANVTRHDGAVTYQSYRHLRWHTEFGVFLGSSEVTPVFRSYLHPQSLKAGSTAAAARRDVGGAKSRDSSVPLTTKRFISSRKPTKTVAVALQAGWSVTNNTTARVTTARVTTAHVTTARVTTVMPFDRYLIYLNDTSYYDVFLKTTMESKLGCLNASSYDAIMAVHSAPGNVVKRQAFRWMYADFNKTYPYKVKVRFFLGKVKNSTLQSALVSENDKYGDLVQGNFIDAYSNLTYKAIFAFKWLNDRCAGFRRLLRLDDDVFLRIDQFFHVWNSKVKKEVNTIMCDAISNDKVRRAGKWLVRKSEISENKYNFQHCLGYFVALTPDLVPRMEAAARRTRFFWIDDIFMYGFVAKKVGARFENVNRDMVRWKEKTFVSCLKTWGRKCNVFTLITKPEKFRMLYSLVQNVTTQRSTKAL